MQNIRLYKYSDIPFVRLLIPILLAIFVFKIYAISLSSYIIYFLIFFLIILLSLHFYIIKRAAFQLNIIWGFILYSYLFILAYTFASLHYQDITSIKKHLKKGFIIGNVNKPPLYKTHSQQIEINIEAIKSQNKWIATEGKCIIYTDTSLNLSPGDRIVFKPKLKFFDTNDAYQQYLLYHGIVASSYIKSNEIHIIEKKATTSLSILAEEYRAKAISILKQLQLPKDVYAIASAITLGYKSDIDYQIRQQYIASGATHLLAVSGLHVGIVYLVIQYLLFFIPSRKWLRWFKLIIILCILWIYAFITGLAPSVLRATTMFTFLAIGKQLNRHTNTYNIIAASALFLIFINPFIVYEIGFQLSYLAVVGIVYLQPKINSIFYFKNKILSWLWSLISVTIAAQIATSPISIYYFHQFPTYFLLSGIILVPITSIVIYLTLLCLLFAPIKTISFYVSLILKQVILFMNNTTHYIEQLPCALITPITINLVQMLLLYLVLVLFTQWLIKKKIHLLYITLSTIILLQIYSIYYKYYLAQQKQIVIYNTSVASTLNFIDNNDNILFIKFYDDSIPLNTPYNIKKQWLELGLSKEKIISFNDLNSQIISNLWIINNPNLFIKQSFINFYGYKILVINDNRFFNTHFNEKINVDAIVLQKYAKVDLSHLLQYVKTKEIIADASCSLSKINRWKEQLQKLNNPNLNFFACRENGDWKKIIQHPLF